jgi:hypothetical protein
MVRGQLAALQAMFVLYAALGLLGGLLLRKFLAAPFAPPLGGPWINP